MFGGIGLLYKILANYWQFLCKDPGVAFCKTFFNKGDFFCFNINWICYFCALRNEKKGKGVTKYVCLRVLKQWKIVLNVINVWWPLKNIIIIRFCPNVLLTVPKFLDRIFNYRRLLIVVQLSKKNYNMFR